MLADSSRRLLLVLSFSQHAIEHANIATIKQNEPNEQSSPVWCGNSSELSGASTASVCVEGTDRDPRIAQEDGSKRLTGSAASALGYVPN